MEITLRFDYYSCDMYIPDGYIKNLEEVHEKFFDWIYDQPECWTGEGKRLGMSYDQYDFVRYINEIVLDGSNEVAYIIPEKKKSSKKNKVLRFI